MHVEQYFKMEGGTVNIRGTKGDCVDVSAAKNITDEFNGQVFIEGGSLTMDVAADDVKGLKSDAEFTISGGTVTASVSGLGTKGISSGGNLLINQTSGNASLVKMTVTGTTYMSGDPLLESKCRGIKVKGEFTFDGGTIDIIATGAKSKAISCGGELLLQEREYQLLRGRSQRLRRKRRHQYGRRVFVLFQKTALFVLVV